MTLIELQDVGLAWDGRTLLHGLDFKIAAGDVWGIVGDNGSGKSTLLRLLSGELSPTEGRVLRAPGVRVVRLTAAGVGPLSVTDLMHEALTPWREARDAVAAEAERLAEDPGRLDRYAAEVDRFERLGGWSAPERHEAAWQKAIPEAFTKPERPLTPGLAQLARVVGAVLACPDVLLLDEPTLPLDVVERERLTQVLMRPAERTACLVASHDRALLHAVTGATARLQAGRLHTRRLAFGDDETQRRTERLRQARVAHEAKKERRRLEAAAAQAQRFGAAAAHGKHLARRAATRSEEAHGTPQRQPDPLAAAGWSWPTRVTEGQRVLSAQSLGIASAFWNVSLDVRMGERWVLLSRGDVRADVLLEVLAGVRANDNPRASIHRHARIQMHLWSERTAPSKSTPLRWVSQGADERLARQSLLKLGLPHDALLQPWVSLSTGQQARVRLAKMMMEQPDVVLLDRPERGLDVAGLEWLERALQDIPAAVLLVTHDLALAEAMADEAAALSEEGLVRYRGGVSGWRQGRRRLTEGTPTGETLQPTSQALEPQDETERLEDRRLALEVWLDDHALGATRERRRAEGTRRELTGAWLEAFDSRLPAPQPRFVVADPPVRLEADRGASGLVFFAPDWPCLPTLVRHGPVVHLMLPDPPSACWLPQMRRKALLLALRLVMEVLAPQAVQTAAADAGEPPAPFERLDNDWWVATLEGFERHEGYETVKDALK